MDDDCNLAADMELRHGLLQQLWDKLHFGNVTSETAAEGYRFQVQTYLDGIPPDAVSVELYADASGTLAQIRRPLTRSMPLVGANNGYLYTGSVPADRPAEHYTPRVIPPHATAKIPLEAAMIAWYK